MTHSKELTALLSKREVLEYRIGCCKQKILDYTIKWEYRESFNRLLRKFIDELDVVNGSIKLIRKGNNKLGGM